LAIPFDSALAALAESAIGGFTTLAVTSSEIVDRADVALRQIIAIYFSPNKTMAELRVEINEGKLDLLRDFSNAAREEMSRPRY
jgi:hypothetical protein